MIVNKATLQLLHISTFMQAMLINIIIVKKSYLDNSGQTVFQETIPK